jgi:hypothetical protein
VVPSRLGVGWGTGSVEGGSTVGPHLLCTLLPHFPPIAKTLLATTGPSLGLAGLGVS